MAATDWFTEWHGCNAKIPSTVIEGLSTAGGGSTAMSTGVTTALSTKASLGHGHPQSDVTGLASTLSAISLSVSTKAAGSHTHVTGDVTGLDSSLAGLALSLSTKAAGTHSHVTGDVTGLDSSLAGLAASISTKAAGVHVHANVTTSTTGFCPILPADSTRFLRSDGTWASPPAGGGGGGIPSTWVTASTHVLTGSTTMQSVTGLSFAMSSLAIYRFEFVMGWQAISSATGLALGVNGPASPTLLNYEVSVSSGLGGMLMKNDRGFGVQTVASLGSSAANLNNYAYLGGVVRTGTANGTLQLQFASEVAGATVSIRGGSVGFLFGPL